MTDIVEPPEIPKSSEFPSNADRNAGVFNSKAFNWTQTSRQMAEGMEASAQATHQNSLATHERAQLANQHKEDARRFADEAAAAAGEVAIAAGAQEWMPGGTYTRGECFWSPSNGQTYRCMQPVSSNTEPAFDPEHWSLLGTPRSRLHAAALSF